MSATVMVNGSLRAKRGVFAAFRAFLNTRYAGEKDRRGLPGTRHVYGNRSRAYGDYLFACDRVIFDEYLWRTLQGRCADEGFDWQAWVTAPATGEENG